MGEEPYERLADALNALPNGFPRTPSGMELRLLKKVFTPAEARLASQMSRTYETVAQIANRVDLPEAQLKEMLDKMRPRALVRQAVIDGMGKFRLGPFVVGWYEAHMPRMDKEFAQLFEQYMAEGGGDRILAPQPGIMGVVPVRGSLKSELLQPYDDIDAHFKRHERFLVPDGLFEGLNCGARCREGFSLSPSSCSRGAVRCLDSE